MKRLDDNNNFTDMSIDCLLKIVNTISNKGNNLYEKDCNLKLILLLKINRRRLIKEYQLCREKERQELYDKILSRIDIAIQSKNDTALRSAFECIKSVYGDDTQSIDSDKTVAQNPDDYDTSDYCQ